MNALSSDIVDSGQVDFCPVRPEIAFEECVSAVQNRRSSRPTETAFPDADDTQLTLGFSEPPLNQVKWSDEDALGLLEGILKSHLKLLNDKRASPEAKRKVIEWVGAPLIDKKKVHYDILSFQACCNAAGVDPEEIREWIIRRFAPERVSILD